MAEVRAAGRGAGRRTAFAALDLGTNNCRLLIAAPQLGGFKVLDGYSRIVRLGEGVADSGRLSEDAMARTLNALRACARKVSSHSISRMACVATQACRSAENGAAFLERVRRETGLHFSVITPEEEARLAVLGCAQLIDPAAPAALVIDIGGGSTELSWVEPQPYIQGAGQEPTVAHWVSLPVGVVTLAERFPEPTDTAMAWYESMVNACADLLACVDPPAALAHRLETRGHFVGTSGTVTSLAGVHLGLSAYRRDRVDGVWLSWEECAAAIEGLRAMSARARALHPCIGRDRADLVLPGCAILEAVARRWGCGRIRVADRGLREGLLLRMARAEGQA